MNIYAYQWVILRTNRNLRYIDPSVFIGIGNADLEMDRSTFLKIHFPNGSFHGLRYTSSTTVAVGIDYETKYRINFIY